MRVAVDEPDDSASLPIPADTSTEELFPCCAPVPGVALDLSVWVVVFVVIPSDAHLPDLDACRSSDITRRLMYMKRDLFNDRRASNCQLLFPKDYTKHKSRKLL